MDGLLFNPLYIHCPECNGLVVVSLEDLQYQDELTCQKCNYQFIPEMDVDALLKMAKAVDAGKFVPVSEDEN